jgi:hypothetical protein
LFDSLEPCGGRGIDPFEQRAFREKVAQIGGKPRHGPSFDDLFIDPLHGSAGTYSLAPRPTQNHPEFA